MSSMSSAPGDHAASTPRPPASEPTPEQLAAEQGVPARGASHYAKGTAANIIRSLAVILAISFAIWLISGRTNGEVPQSVDVVGTAEQRAQQAGQPFVYPEGLPEGWMPTTVRYRASQDGVMTWTAGYTTPEDQYVSVQQGVDADEDWVEVRTHSGEAAGSLTTQDGRTWERRGRDNSAQRSLVLEAGEGAGASGSTDLTTVVTGTVGWDQLELFADALVEADPQGSPAS